MPLFRLTGPILCIFRVHREITIIVGNDFRNYAKAQFVTVSKMCSLCQQILNSSIPIWLQTEFITAHVISQTEFDTQIDGLLEEFKRKTADESMQVFKLMQATNSANQLATTLASRLAVRCQSSNVYTYSGCFVQCV